MLVRNPLPAKDSGATVGVVAAVACELGATVAVAAEHAVSSNVAAPAHAMRACVQGEGKVTPTRIAERSRLSRHRCEENSRYDNALRAPCHAAGTGAHRPARRAH